LFQNCAGDAYLAPDHWIVDHSDLVILVWNGYPAGGKGCASLHNNLMRLWRITKDEKTLFSEEMIGGDASWAIV